MRPGSRGEPLDTLRQTHRHAEVAAQLYLGGIWALPLLEPSPRALCPSAPSPTPLPSSPLRSSSCFLPSRIPSLLAPPSPVHTWLVTFLASLRSCCPSPALTSLSSHCLPVLISEHLFVLWPPPQPPVPAASQLLSASSPVPPPCLHLLAPRPPPASGSSQGIWICLTPQPQPAP